MRKHDLNAARATIDTARKTAQVSSVQRHSLGKYAAITNPVDLVSFELLSSDEFERAFLELNLSPYNVDFSIQDVRAAAL